MSFYRRIDAIHILPIRKNKRLLSAAFVALEVAETTLEESGMSSKWTPMPVATPGKSSRNSTFFCRAGGFDQVLCVERRFERC
jgi:hypothetical protein